MAEKKELGGFGGKKGNALIGNELEKSRRLPSLRHQRPAPTKEGLARFDLLRRGRQGKAGSPGIYSLSHGVGFQPNAVTAPSGRRLQFGILQIQEAFTRPQEGAEERAPAKILRSKRFVGKGDAGVKSAAIAVRQSLAYAPCGDAGGKEERETSAFTPSVTVSAYSRTP